MHPTQCTLDATLHRAFGFAQESGSFPVRITPEISELYSLTLVCRKLTNHVAQLVSHGEAYHLLLKIVFGGRVGHSVLLLAPLTPAVRTQSIDCTTVREVQQERPETSTIGVEALRAMPEVHERVVSDLPRGPLVAEHLVCDGEHRS